MKNAGTKPTKAEMMGFYRKIRGFYRSGYDTAQSVNMAKAYVAMHIIVYANTFTTNEIISMAEAAGITMRKEVN